MKEKRPGNVKFVAGVIFHVAKLLKEKELESFVETAVSFLAPECLGPTFNTRLACQANKINNKLKKLKNPLKFEFYFS